ncbi:hypothetical protein ACQP1V_17435 [Microtetraspora malaysiensis]|uniref:hypothetical protein n=1 Tax=Microtetraspora malaysiensis TaxID=161358 RepID=UPI003D9150BA
MAVRLIVLRGSAARRLYERHGFTVERADLVDILMVRQPAARCPELMAPARGERKQNFSPSPGV